MKKDSDLSFLSTLKIPPSLSSTEYEFKGDREALAALKSIPGAGALMAKWLEFWLEFSRSGFLGAAVKVSPKQFPEVDALRRRAAEVLGIEAPPVFIIETPVINAMTLGTEKDNVIVAVTRPLLEAATPKELAFILGHEFGHAKSGHALYATLAVVLANMGILYGARALPVHLLVWPLEMALKAWFRRSEITCDRAGLIACQDLEAGRRALLLLGCCSRELADRIDLEEFLKQGDEARQSHGRWGELNLTHPTLPKRLRCLDLFSQSAVYKERLLGDRSGGLGREELDLATAEALGADPPGTPGLAQKLGEFGHQAGDAARGAGSTVLGALAKGMEAAAGMVEPDSPAKKKRKPSK